MIIFRPSAINPSISLRDHTRFVRDMAGAISMVGAAEQLEVDFKTRIDNDGRSASNDNEMK